MNTKLDCSILKNANSLFRAGKYAEALEQYNKYIQINNGELSQIVEINITLAKKRISPTTQITDQKTKLPAHYLTQDHEKNLKQALSREVKLYKNLLIEPFYVRELTKKIQYKKNNSRVIAFYLPQFHAIPENDEWWGKGFTEWTNVKPAVPRFVGHYQPHLPDKKLGYYDLNDISVMKKQVDLAKKYDIYGFCFYAYWFSGKRLLEIPLDNYLEKKSLDLPFCVCWANENWSRRWDGRDQDLLMIQEHSESDDIEFISAISKYLIDERYIRIDNKPLLLIYRPNLFQCMAKTAEMWRDWCRKNGIGEIYLAYPQSFESVDPSVYGFDAAIEFPPNNASPPEITETISDFLDDFEGKVFDWRFFVEKSKDYADPSYKLFRSVNPGWDNTARKKKKGFIFHNSSPFGYQIWLKNAIDNVSKNSDSSDDHLVFVNAWNEWAEGAHLEPDLKYGYAYLEATKMAQVRHLIECNKNKSYSGHSRIAFIVHAFYPDVFREIISLSPIELKNTSKLFVTTTQENEREIIEICRVSGFDFKIFIFENRGRDVLPFLEVLKKINLNFFPYILKLHTKKSLHRKDGDTWRNDLYSKLLDQNLVKNIFNFFSKNPDIGLLAPEGHTAPLSFYWGANEKTVRQLTSRLGLLLESVENELFIAGTMFYAKTDALIPLLNIQIDHNDFEIENGQVDGTFAHAIERTISLSAKSVGYSISTTKHVSGSTASERKETLGIDDIYKSSKSCFY